MKHTAIQSQQALVSGGTSQTGLKVQPWVFDAYAPPVRPSPPPATWPDFATALLDGTAPGMRALAPPTTTPEAGMSVGDFWAISSWESGQTVTWHNGQTASYTSYFGMDRDHHKAVVVLSDVATQATTTLGTDLLRDPRGFTGAR